MVEVGVNYLNPLTLEATMFLNSLEKFTKVQNNEIDTNLYNVLDSVVCAIEKYVSKQPVPIVQTKNTKLVAVKKLESIQRLYQCKLCQQCLGKSAEKATLHLTGKHCQEAPQNETRKKSPKPIPKKKVVPEIKLPKKANSLVLSDFAQFFTDNIKIAEKLKKIPEYDVIEQDIMALITPLFPEKPIKLYKFGSRIAGIATRNSDLDIFVDIGNCFKNLEERASPETLNKLTLVRGAINKDSKNWTLHKSVENARVPILRVCHLNTGIECDIGFSNGLGFCNTELMAYLFELQPVARRMCIFLKKWIERSKLTDMVSTYSIILMVIYFLQLNRHLPSIKDLIIDTEDSGCVGPWNAYFVKKSLQDVNIKIVSLDHCKKLLKNFFELYTEFNYALYAVCPYLGIRMEINQIRVYMPERYINYISATPDSVLETNKAMVVQDPFQLNHNVAKRVTPITLKQLKDYFRQTAEAFAKLK